MGVQKPQNLQFVTRIFQFVTRDAMSSRLIITARCDVITINHY